MPTVSTRNPQPHFLLLFARLFVGVLFLFSGLIKANDPLGFSYKLQEYFEVFHLIFLNDYAVILAILLCSLEMILGVLLLLGLYGKKVAWGLLLLILFFTFLTFYSAYFHVVTSCGCFGDAIPLTPWQSFSKDLILLLLIAILFYFRSQIRPLISNETSRILTLLVTIFVSLSIGIYTYNFLPFIDFLPYKEGNNLPKLMHIPKGAPLDEYEVLYTIRNKKSSETKQVTDKTYLKDELWKNENWEIIGDPESRLVKEGYKAPIKDLLITDAQGVDHTDEIIANPYYNLLVVGYDVNKSNFKALKKINQLAKDAAEQFNIRTIFLTSSSAQTIHTLDAEMKLFMEVFYADVIPLKSMVRANPGILLMKNGTVIKKWHYHTLPNFEVLSRNYFEQLD